MKRNLLLCLMVITLVISSLIVVACAEPEPAPATPAPASAPAPATSEVTTIVYSTPMPLNQHALKMISYSWIGLKKNQAAESSLTAIPMP